MQPGTNPEDINAILNRFHTWADKHPAEGNGNGHSNGAGLDEVREFSYEEAIREHRNRGAARTPRPKAAPPPKNAAPAQQKSTVKAVPPAPEVAPEPQRRFISSLEILAALNNVAPSPPLQDAPKPVAYAAPKPASNAAPAAAQTAAKAASEHAPQFQSQSTPKAAVQPTRKPAPYDPPFKVQQENVQPAVEVRLKAAAPTPTDRPSPARRPVAAKSAIARAPKPKPADAFRQMLADAVTQSAPDAHLPAKRPGAGRVRSSCAKTATPTKTAAAVRHPAFATAKKASVIAKPEPKAALAAVRSSLIRPQTAMAMESVAQNPAPRRSAAPAVGKIGKSKPVPSHQVMVGRAQQPKAQAASKRKPDPDRTPRITTRFSAAEERRIEKQAADLGLNVSAYLRQCALGAAAAQNTLAREPLNARANQRAGKSTAQTMPNFNNYSVSAPSVLGGWLALLRNRFLGPPVRFSNQA